VFAFTEQAIAIVESCSGTLLSNIYLQDLIRIFCDQPTDLIDKTHLG